MKDRFTVVLVATVAFVGGLLAMVFVARWQTGAPSPPATRSDVVAQVVPEVAPETIAPKRTTSAGAQTAVEPRPSEPQETIATEIGSSREVERSVTTGAGRASAPSNRTAGHDAVVRDEVRTAGRSEPEPRRGASATRPLRDNRSTPSSGSSSSGASAGRTGSSGGTKSSAGALPQDRNLMIGGSQETGRSMGRQPAAGALSGGAPAETTGPSDTTGANDNAPLFPDDTPEPDPYEPPDPLDDPPLDDPADDPQNNPEPEPEPEIPVALVKAYTALGMYNLDDVVPVQVAIQSGTDVGHVPFHLAYDPRVLRFERSEEGQFLNMDGSATVFFAVPSGSGDAVIVGLSRLGNGPGIDGAGSLCLLHFVAVAPGTTQLRFRQADVKDSRNVRMPSVFNAGAVTVVQNP